MSRARRTARVASSSMQRVVPQLAGEDPCEPEPSRAAGVTVLGVAAKHLERAAHQRYRCAVSVREPRRDAVQQQIDRARRRRLGWRGASGLGDFAEGGVRAQAPGEDRRAERFEVRLAGEAIVETLRGAWRRRGAAAGRRCPRLRAKTISARRRASWACWSSSSGPISAAAISASAASKAAASNLARAARALVRIAGPGSAVNSSRSLQERRRRRRRRHGSEPRSADRSRSAATSSSGSAPRAPDAQARRSGSS